MAGGLLAAGVAGPRKYHRIVVCAWVRGDRSWSTIRLGGSDEDTFTQLGFVVFNRKPMLLGTVGTWTEDGQLYYDAAMWTCDAHPPLRCPRVPDPANVLGGIEDQFIQRLAITADGRLIARGGSGRGTVCREVEWIYDGTRLTRRLLGRRTC